MQFANNIFFAQVEQMLAEGNEVQLRVKGYSMRPLLRDGREVVVLAPCTNQKLHCHDLVLFRYAGHHILHRIIRIDGDRITLEGDGNYRLQEHCKRDDVVAVAKYVIRCSGRKIDCNGIRWRFYSHTWKLLPAIVRRYLLAILFRIGYK